MPLLRRRSTFDLLLPELRVQLADDNASNGTEHNRPPTNLSQRPSSSMGVPSVSRPEEYDRPNTPPLQHPTPATKRFSMLRFRHFSDSQLSARARNHAEQHNRPPLPDLPGHQTISSTMENRPLRDSEVGPPPHAPTAPVIITTAPTVDIGEVRKNKKARTIPFKRQLSRLSTKSPTLGGQEDGDGGNSADNSGFFSWRKSHDSKRGADGMPRPSESSLARSALGTSINSAASTQQLNATPEEGSGFGHIDHDGRERGTGFKEATKKRSTLFNMSTRSKRKSLFPVPVKLPPPSGLPDTAPATPRESISGLSVRTNGSPEPRESPGAASPRRRMDHGHPHKLSMSSESPLHADLPRSNVAFAPRGYPLLRYDSTHSAASTRSSPNIAPPRRLGVRGRASTMSTYGRPSDDMTPPTPPTLGSGSARNSTSTGGRASLGGFLTLNRFRHGSDANTSRHDSPGTHSKSNSFAISREQLVLPDREEGEPPGKYLEKLQAGVSRSVIAGMLSRSADPFTQAVLRSYTRRFAFFGEPIDMSLRKFLLEAELPKETQQVDRVVQAFADRYHECNPGIFHSPDQAYIIAFSLMMLHTDAFNKNNKRKMQKSDYIKNTSGQMVSEDVLACFYDNICYTPFIHFDDDDFDVNSERMLSLKSKKTKLKGTMPDQNRKPLGPVDPYALIMDAKLELLRPSIKESITLEDPYSYLGNAKTLDLQKVQKAFVNTGILQIISARSRPAAFESQATRDNPGGSRPGVVDLRVTKVGILWRKSTKKKKTRSPWQEWGAILTGAQLYFFKNVAWVKNLMHQHNTHVRHGNYFSPVVFKPPISDFKPDTLIKTDDAVALLDASYTRHKNAFTLVRHGGEEEILLADNESELNEWLAFINYAAAFRSAGVRIRGSMGAATTDVGESGKPAGESLNDSVLATEPLPVNNNMSPQLTLQVMAARHQLMMQRIAKTEYELNEANGRLESMLQNARHLQVLAPIQPRTREVVILSAGRMDAMLKWIRRDIWRMKCHKDILSLDAREDSDAVTSHSRKLAAAATSGTTDPALAALHRQLSSPNSVVSDQPKSPDSLRSAVRPRTMSSGHDFLATDIFKTPPENLRQEAGQAAWRLPPLDMDAQQAQQRKSMTSTIQSTASVRRPSLAPVSPALSAAETDKDTNPRSSLQVARGASTLNANQVTPVTSRQTDVSLAPISTVSTTGKSPSDSMATATPESVTKGRNQRRSLHRTLRDSHHQHGSVHRHRRGKESAGTAKSDASAVNREETPGLERGKGRFTVHGKQASVITFGSDWADDKLRQARGDANDTTPRARIRVDDTTSVNGEKADIDNASLLREGREPTNGYLTESTARSPSASPSRSYSYSASTRDVDQVDPDIYPSVLQTSALASEAAAIEHSPTQSHGSSSEDKSPNEFFDARDAQRESVAVSLRHQSSVVDDEDEDDDYAPPIDWSATTAGAERKVLRSSGDGERISNDAPSRRGSNATDTSTDNERGLRRIGDEELRELSIRR